MHTSSGNIKAIILSLLAGSAALCGGAAQAGTITQQNLVTDDQAFLTGTLHFAPAANVDTRLINPWGISHTPASPFWISDQGNGTATVYNSQGVNIQANTTTIPPVPAGPTGQVVNNVAADFHVGGQNGPAANFMFATLQGTIAARSGNPPTTVTVVNNAGLASYTGLAIGDQASGNMLYAANFKQGTIDVFDNTFRQVASNFTDPNLPPGYVPYNVQTLNGNVYVTYTKVDPETHRALQQSGNGIIDKFGLNGGLVARVGTEGKLDAPWGLDIAPSGFGEFANDLLVGNFGDGTIDVFDPNNFDFLGTIKDSNGNDLAIDGLWALINGTGGVNGGDPNSVFFSAGIGDEQHGLFGRLYNAPEPASLALFGMGLAALGGFSSLRRKKIAV